MSKTNTLRELLDNLSPYFLNLAIDQENGFTPYISILFPVKWKIFKNVNFIMESFAYSDAAHKYHIYLRDSEGDFDELVDHILSIIDWNHEYEEKMKVLEVEKEKFLKEQEAKLKEMEDSILPKPLAAEDESELIYLERTDSSPSTVEEYGYADEMDSDLESVVQHEWEPVTPVAAKYGSKIVIDDDNEEVEVKYDDPSGGLPMLVNEQPSEGDILDEYDAEEDARLNKLISDIGKNNPLAQGTT